MTLAYDVARCRAAWIGEQPHPLCAACQRFKGLQDLGMRTPVMLAPAQLLYDSEGKTRMACDAVIPQ